MFGSCLSVRRKLLKHLGFDKPISPAHLSTMRTRPGALAACRQRGTKGGLQTLCGRDTDVPPTRGIKKAVAVCGPPIWALQNPQALGDPRAFFMPSFGRKRLGLASTARQAGEGHKRIDSTVSVRALPGGILGET